VKNSYGVSGEKIICCGPCQSEPINAKFSLIKTGFVSGESISFNSILENETSRKIKPMTVKLVQILIQIFYPLYK
jgi:phage head maturation protease